MLRGIPLTRQNVSMTEEWNATTSHTECKIFEGNIKSCMWLSVQKSVTACASQHLFFKPIKDDSARVKVLQPHCGSCRGQATGNPKVETRLTSTACRVCVAVSAPPVPVSKWILLFRILVWGIAWQRPSSPCRSLVPAALCSRRWGCRR